MGFAHGSRLPRIVSSRTAIHIRQVLDRLAACPTNPSDPNVSRETLMIETSTLFHRKGLMPRTPLRPVTVVALLTDADIVNTRGLKPGELTSKTPGVPINPDALRLSE